MLESKIVETSPQLFKRVHTFIDNPKQDKKAIRAEAIYTSTVTFNNWVFDANENSMNRMTRYIQIANFDFNTSILNGETHSDAYRTHYVFKTIDWKLADDTVQTITIENLIAVYKLAVENMASTWF